LLRQFSRAQESGAPLKHEMKRSIAKLERFPFPVGGTNEFRPKSRLLLRANCKIGKVPIIFGEKVT